MNRITGMNGFVVVPQDEVMAVLKEITHYGISQWELTRDQMQALIDGQVMVAFDGEYATIVCLNTVILPDFTWGDNT